MAHMASAAMMVVEADLPIPMVIERPLQSDEGFTVLRWLYLFPTRALRAEPSDKGNGIKDHPFGRQAAPERFGPFQPVPGHCNGDN